MEKKYERTAEEIARDLDSVVLPGISDEDLADAFGGARSESIIIIDISC
jgi:hypothetical protein